MRLRYHRQLWKFTSFSIHKAEPTCNCVCDNAAIKRCPAHYRDGRTSRFWQESRRRRRRKELAAVHERPSYSMGTLMCLNLTFINEVVILPWVLFGGLGFGLGLGLFLWVRDSLGITTPAASLHVNDSRKKIHVLLLIDIVGQGSLCDK